MKKRSLKKKNQNWTQSISVMAISLFAVLFVVNMNEPSRDSESSVHIKEVTLDSYLGFAVNFRDKQNGLDPYPTEVTFVTKSKNLSAENGSEEQEKLNRIEMSCEYSKDDPQVDTSLKNDFKMVRIYPYDQKQSIDQMHAQGMSLGLNFQDVSDCQYWLEEIYGQIAITKMKNKAGKFLAKKYQIKYDSQSNLILDITKLR